MKYNARILIVDDNKSIHEDFRKVLTITKSVTHQEVDDLEAELFEQTTAEDDQENDVGVTIDQQLLNYEMDSAYQGQDALSMIQTAEEEGQPYALVFMDVRMPPGWDGVETISRIWLKFPYIEMVLCTAYSDYSWDDIVSKLGTTDKLLFLRKPFDAVAVQQMSLTLVKKWNLSEQARNYVKKLEGEVQVRTVQLEKLLSELEQKNEKLMTSNKMLKHVALHDSLTKLPNRELFHDRLAHAIKMSERQKTRFAVFLIDVDEFKKVNDTYGHLAGDSVLYEVGERLSLVLRSSDTVARLGGDEFALILLNINDDAPKLLAKKILSSMSLPTRYGEYEIDVSLSVGVALYPCHGVDADELVSHADTAMYDAKSLRVGYSVYDYKHEKEPKDSYKLSVDLTAAIENKEILLHFQPILDLESGACNCVEALVRWWHPSRGLLEPEQFIYLAERKGLIKQLTLCIFDSALEQCSLWHQQGIMVKLAINLSSKNFFDPNLAEEISIRLAKWKVEPAWLQLEITENMIMSQSEKAKSIIATLVEMGVQVSIDDFGMRQCSLSILKELQISELKIDKSIIMDMSEKNDNALIVESTVKLAKELALDLVAEGIENAETSQLARDIGCSKGQGYFMCKPQAANEITAWLLEAGWGKPELNKAEGEN